MGAESSPLLGAERDVEGGKGVATGERLREPLRQKHAVEAARDVPTTKPNTPGAADIHEYPDPAKAAEKLYERARSQVFMIKKRPLWMVSADFTYERVRSRWATTFLVSAVFLILFIFIDVIMVEFPTVKGFFGPLVKFLLMFAVTLVASILLLVMLVWNNPLMPLSLVWHLGGVLTLGGGIAGVILFLVRFHDDFAGSHSAAAGYFYFSVLGLLLGGAVVCYLYSFISRRTFHQHREEVFRENVKDKLKGWRTRLRELQSDSAENTPEEKAVAKMASGYKCFCGAVFHDIGPSVQHLRLSHHYQDHLFVEHPLAVCLGSDLSKVAAADVIKESLTPHKDTKNHTPRVGLADPEVNVMDKKLKKMLKARRKALRSKDVVLMPAVVLTGSIVSFTLLTFFFIKITVHLPDWHDKLIGVRDQIESIMIVVQTYDPGLIETFPDIPEFIDSFDKAFISCGAIGVVLGYLVATVLTIVFPVIFFRSTLLRMRKGTCHDRGMHQSQPYLPKTHLLAKATYFIAVQFSTALIGFFLLSAGIFFGLIIPFWDVTQDLILALKEFILAIVIVKIVQKVLFEKVFINMLVSDGKRIRQPTLWALVSIVSMFYTLFTGVITAIVRLFLLVGIGVMALFRLDTTLYPRPLAMLDSGFVAFMSVVSMHNRYNNPIATVAVQLFLDHSRCVGRIPHDKFTKEEKKMFKEWRKDEKEGIPPADRKGKEPPFSNYPEGERRQKIARNKWHLAYTLINNPGLIGHRMSDAAKAIKVANNAAMLRQMGINVSTAELASKVNATTDLEAVIKEGRDEIEKTAGEAAI